MRTDRETCLAYNVVSPAEQVKALVDLLAGKGVRLLQAPDKMPDSPLGSQNNGKSSEVGGGEYLTLSPCPGTSSPVLSCVPQTQGYGGTVRPC